MGAIEPRPAVTPIDLANEPEFDLGGLRVKPAERAVVMKRERRDVQPRVMQVLVALADARPAVVSRDALVERCWSGRIVGDDALNRCIMTLRNLAQEFMPAPFSIETVPRVGHRLIERPAEGAVAATQTGRSKPWRLLALLMVILLAAVAGLIIWQQRIARVSTVLVTAGANDAASLALARDLATKLGSLQPVQPASMRLIGQAGGSSNETDLVLTVETPAETTRVGASVVLTGAPHRSILWSKDFEQPSRSLADLKQQIAHAAARVLGCAVEGKDRLSEEVLKTYLTACAAPPDPADPDFRTVVRMLENVVMSSPSFVGGWAKLLSAEIVAVEDPVFPEGAALKPALKRHILAARKIEADLPEAYLGEYSLMPPADFVGRARLLDEGVRRSPHHAGARSYRSLFFSSVGRMNDAVREAREAVRLDPLSPVLRDGYVSSLVYAGHVDAALAEVSKAERLWPGASSVTMARYRVHLRYGDPKEALRLIRSRAIDMPIAPFHQTFLEARIDPSLEKIENAIRQLRSVYRDAPLAIDSYAQALAEFGRREELLELLNSARAETVAWVAEVLFRPAFSDLHRDPRFMQVANRTGLLKYWRTTGEWPDFCFAPDLPYDCKAEAAKIAPLR